MGFREKLVVKRRIRPDYGRLEVAIVKSCELVFFFARASSIEFKVDRILFSLVVI